MVDTFDPHDFVPDSSPVSAATPASPATFDPHDFVPDVPENSFSANLQSELDKTGERGAKALENPNNDALTRAMVGANTGFGVIGDYPKAAAETAYKSLPQGMRDTISSFGDVIAGTMQKPATYGTAKAALPDKTADLNNAVAQLEYEHPNISQGMELAGNVAGAIPIAKGASTLADGVSDLMKTVGNPLVDRAPPMTAAEKYTGILPEGQRSSYKPVSGARPYYPNIKKAFNDLRDNTNSAYAQIPKLGVTFSPEVSAAAASDITDYVDNAVDGLDKDNHPQTLGALNSLSKKSEDGFNANSLENTRKKLNYIAYDSTARATDKFAAQKALRGLDDFWGKVADDPSMMDTGSPSIVNALKDARAAYATQATHEMFGNIVRNANGDWVKIESGFQKLFNDKEEFERLSPQDQQAVDAIAHPQKMARFLETVGYLGYGGRGEWMPRGETLSLLGAAYSPAALAGAIPLTVGTAANMVRGRIVRNAADNLLRSVESRSVPAFDYSGKYMDEMAEAVEARKSQPAPPKPLALPAPSIKMPSDQSGLYKQLPAPNPNEPGRPVVNERNTTQFNKPTRGTVRPMTQEELENHIAQQQEMERSEKELGLTPDVRAAQQDRAATNEAARKARAAEAYRRNSANQGQVISPSDMRRPVQDYPQDVPPFLRGKFARGGAVNTKPTPGQKIAGNYKKGHEKVHGLDITIENPKGSQRTGKTKEGKEWKSTLGADYGYIKRTQGADGDHVDCYLGNHHDSKRVYVMDQLVPETGEFDEHKCFLCFSGRDEAIKSYRDSFSDDKVSKRIGHIRRFTISEFKSWLKSGKTHLPVRKVA